MSLLHSVTVVNEQRSSAIDQNDNPVDEDQSTINNQTTSKLRTFCGWKRNPAQLDKGRLSRGSWQSNVTILIFIISLSIDWFFNIDIN